MSCISPRIWRSPESRFNDDEPLNCAEVYTPEVLAGIREQGFDAIWMRGRLCELIRSEIYPELNDSKAVERIANLRKVIAAGKKIGVDVYLYFNEPLALPREHGFWKNHPELVGEPFVEPELDWDVLSFCTSTPQFKKFFAESTGNLFDDLIGLGGVILITASEYQSHCWSHRARRSIGDKYLDKCMVKVECPNCSTREPADVVGELVGTWKTQADMRKPSPRVWAWNWSWSIWYERPQREVIEKLPDGAELMCDFERGGKRRQAIGEIAIDEYSLGYVGPSEQFVAARAAALKKNIQMCAKLQIGTTHELATVPNLPLIPNLFEKLKKIDEMAIKGLMCSWNFGNSPSVNTAAMKLFATSSESRKNKKTFCDTLAAEYFSSDQPEKITAAWEKFREAFNEYPFSIKMLYHGPMNYSVAYPLKLQYEDRPMGPSWIGHSPFGDRLEDCMEPFTIEQVLKCLDLMSRLWNEGIKLYSTALCDTQNPYHVDELTCAKMIGCHLIAAKNIFEFHAWRRRKMQIKKLNGPCILVGDSESAAIIAHHLEVMRTALDLAEKDNRLGYHQEPHEYFYTPESIKAAMKETQKDSTGI